MNDNHNFSPLETSRLLLRPLDAGDLDFVFQHFSDPEINRFLLDEEPVTTQEQAQAIVDSYSAPGSKPYNRWVVVRKVDHRPIGTCGFHRWQKAHQRRNWLRSGQIIMETGSYDRSAQRGASIRF